MKPPKRKRVTATPRELQIEEYSRWSLTERKKLLKALQTYSVKQTRELAKMVSTKSETEVIYFLSKLKHGCMQNATIKKTKTQREYMKNSESWLRFAHEMVDDEEENYTHMVGKLLALYGEYNFRKRDPVTGVNFRTIYNYLSGLLLGVQQPVLPPLEAAVVLDLLKNVATYLAQSDISIHKKFINLKYQKHMYPNSIPKGLKEQSFLQKLCNEDPTPPDVPTSSSSSSCPSLRLPYETNKIYYTEKVLSDGKKATVVHLKKIDASGGQDISKPQSEGSKSSSAKEPQNEISETSKSSLTRTESSGVPLNGTSENSSTSVMKPVTNVRRASKLADLIIANSVNETNETQKEVSEKQKDESDVPVLKDPKVLPSQQDQQNVPMQQDPKNLPKDCVSVTQAPNGERVQQKSRSGCINQVSSDDNVLHVPNEGSRLHLPSGGTIFHLPDGVKLLHLPNGGILKNEQDGTSVQIPSGSTVKQGKDSMSIFKGPKASLPLPAGVTLKNMQSSTSDVLPSGSTVKQSRERMSISFESNTPLVPPKTAGSKVPARNILTSLLTCPQGDIIKHKMRQMNNKNFVPTSSPPKSPIKIFKVSTEGLVAQGTHYRSPNKGTSNVEVSSPGCSASSPNMSMRINARADSQPIVMIVDQTPNVSMETKTLGASIKTLKRKLSMVESETASTSDKRHCGGSNDKNVDPDTGPEEPSYRPSISWLNPMEIPFSLFNLTVTDKKKSLK